MQVRKMYSKINQQIFCWAGDERLEIDYDGNRIVVPGVNETASLARKNGFQFESARDSDGELIAGTIVVGDIVATDDVGRKRKVLDVASMCDYLTQARDDLFARGFNIVGSIQEIQDAFDQGRPLYEEAQDARARAILASELERRRKYESKGEPAPPREDEYNVVWAIGHLRKRGQRKPQTSVDDIRTALEGGYVPPQAVESVVPTPKVAPAPPKRAVSASEIYQQAMELGVTLTKTELAGLLGNDQEQTAFVMEKIKVKRAAAPPA